jgi:hypothetical protein
MPPSYGVVDRELAHDPVVAFARRLAGEPFG